MTCDKAVLIHRYHDGELAPSERELVEQHLSTCGECATLLADLRGLSLLISQAALTQPSTRMFDDVGRRWRQKQNQGVLRAAAWLSAAAAAVLVGAVLSWPSERAELGSPPGIWESVAVRPSVQASDDPSAELVVMAQWMTDELSTSEMR